MPRLRQLAVAILFLTASLARAEEVIPFGICGVLNPVTNQSFAGGSGEILVVDGATHAVVTTVPIAGTPTSLQIDAFRNRIYVTVAAGGGSDLWVIDGSDWSTRLVVAGTPQVFAAVDPIHDEIWVSGNPAARIDGETLVSTPLDFGANASFLTIDPIAHRVYYSVHTPSFHNRLVEVDGTSLAMRDVPVPGVESPNPMLFPDFYQGGVAVNPWTGRLYQFGVFDPSYLSGTLVAIQDATTFADLGSTFVGGYYGVLPGPVDPMRDIVWVYSGNDIATLDSFHGADLSPASDSVRLQNLTFGGSSSWLFDDVANRIYVTENNGSVVTNYDADAHANTTLATSLVFLAGLTLNRTEAELCTSGFDPVTFEGAISVLDAPEKRPVPITTTLWNEPPDASGHVVVHVSGASAFTPFAPPIRNLWTQADAIDGPWSPATPAGSAGTQTFTLAPGAHEVHAFANDGQEIGPTTTLAVHVAHTLPKVDIDVKSPFAGETIPRPGAFPFQLSVVNATGGPQTFAFLISLSVPGVGTMYLLPPTGMQIPNGVGFAAAVQLPIDAGLPVGTYTLGGVVFQAGGGIVDQSVTTFTVQ